MDETDANTGSDPSVSEGRKGVAAALTASTGIFGRGKQAQSNLKILSNIESSARLASINAKRVQYLLGVALGQTEIISPGVQPVETIPTTTPGVVRKKSISTLQAILGALLGALPLLLNEKVRDNLKEYFSNLLKGMGFTTESIDNAVGILKLVGGLFVAYGIYKIISIFRRAIKLIGLVVKVLGAVVRALGIIRTIPNIDLPDGSRGRPGGAPWRPTPPPPRGPGPVAVPPVTRLPPPTTARPLLAPPVVPPRLVELRARGAAAEDARIIRETIREPVAPPPRTTTTVEPARLAAPPAPTPSTSALGSIIDKIGRVIPLLNLVLGAYDLYNAVQLYQEGNTKDAVISAVGGIGAILLGVGTLIAAPVLGPVLTGIGLVASLGATLKWFYDKLSDNNNSNLNVMPPGEIPNPEPVYNMNESVGKLNQLSTDVVTSKTSRVRDTNLVILTKPVIVYNRSFA